MEFFIDLLIALVCVLYLVMGASLGLAEGFKLGVEGEIFNLGVLELSTEFD